MLFNNNENGIANINEEGLEEGYQLKFASGTSRFSGDTVPILENAGIWNDLQEVNYVSTLRGKLFKISSAQRNTSILSNILPRLHIALTFPHQKTNFFQPHVVLILDNNNNYLVDWAIPSLNPPTSFFQAPSDDRVPIYFDVPLVPVTRQKPTDKQGGLIDRINQWNEGESLTFGIFRIEDMDFWYLREWRFFGRIHFNRFFPWFHRETSDLTQKADNYLKTGGEVLQQIDSNGVPQVIQPTSLRDLRNCKVLLFCHGIFSSTAGAFADIFNNKACLDHLYGNYTKILAWDHYTLSKTTAENATDLVNILEHLEHVEIDIVCHSRGAGVIRNFIENNSNRTTLSGRHITINKVIFVAGACLGSQLAEPQNANRLFRHINMLVWWFDGMTPGFTKAILTILKLLSIFAQNMSGVRSLNPAGPEIAELNSYGDTLAKEYHYIRANFSSNVLPLKLLEAFLLDSSIFNGAANDLIVPYEGASPSGKYLTNHQRIMKNALSYGSDKRRQSNVTHVNFFSQPPTRKKLIDLLP